MELERALEAGVRVIVIEPEPLGEETARWIYVGNLLHKVSVYSGLCSIASGIYLTKLLLLVYITESIRNKNQNVTDYYHVL